MARSALHSAREALNGVMIPCGFTHGDFAPWNTCIRNGKLFVFDWESANWELPLAWDLFHFETQVECLLGKKGSAEARHGLRVEKQKYLFVLYLLHSVCDFVEEAGSESHAGVGHRYQRLAQELGRR
ncbi:MAG: hypothetical protein ACRD50_02520 [Candidatus Acidiferrales bacterium]